jgi:hypothetical protein
MLEATASALTDDVDAVEAATGSLMLGAELESLELTTSTSRAVGSGAASEEGVEVTCGSLVVAVG